MSKCHNDNSLQNSPENVPQDAQEQALQARLDRGSEPFWMQDIRLAQRRIDAQRARSAHSSPDMVEDP